MSGPSVIEKEVEEIEETADSVLYKGLESVILKCRIRWERINLDDEIDVINL